MTEPRSYIDPPGPRTGQEHLQLAPPPRDPWWRRFLDFLVDFFFEELPEGQEPEPWGHFFQRVLGGWWFTHPTSPWVWVLGARERRVRRFETWWSDLGRLIDPIGGLIDWKRAEARFRLYMGLLSDHSPAMTPDDSALLVLGPPGSLKTAGIMIINALMAGAGLFCISSRSDIFRAVAKIRSRFGEVWVFSATGRKQKGAQSRRLSMKEGCKERAKAAAKALRLLSNIDFSEYALRAGHVGHTYFRDRGTAVLTALFHIEAWLDLEETWFYTTLVTRNFAIKIRQLQHELEDDPILDELQVDFDALEFILSASDEERGSILGTVANALGAFKDPDVMRQMNDESIPVIDFRKLVRGEPHKPLLGVYGRDTKKVGALEVYSTLLGAWPSLFIVDADGESPTSVLVSEVEACVREAAYEYAQECEDADLPRPIPVTVVNDEGFVSPPYQVGKLVAEHRNRGISYTMALQSLSQARTLYGDLGKDFITLFRTIVVFPGIRDEDTLKTLSLLAGEDWQRINQVTYSQDGKQGPSVTPTYTKRPRLDPAQIYAGHPDWPDAALTLIPGVAEYGWIDVAPYHRREPWPRLFINALERTDPDSYLPLTALARDNDYSTLKALGLEERFRDLQRHYNQLREDN